MDVLKIRKSLGMTQAEFASAIGVDKSVVYRYEHGLISPSKEKRDRIDYIVSVGGKDLLLETRSEAVKSDVSDKYIRRLMIMGSDGCCELCGQNAPFTDKENRPFLYLYVTDNNEDVDITHRCVTLCPNCYAKVNVLKNAEDIESLKKKAEQHRY